MVFPENIFYSYLNSGLRPIKNNNFNFNDLFNVKNKNYNCFTNLEFDKIVENIKKKFIRHSL